MIMDKKIKYAIGAGIVTAAVAGVSAYILNTMCDLAVRSKVPNIPLGSQEKLTGIDDEVYLEIVRKSRDAALSFESERVEITSHDGIRLVGRIIHADEPKRFVVAMHGWRSEWAIDFGMVAGFLKEQGCTVLYPDQRGQGESQGDYMGFGVLERFDCLSWIHYMNKRFGEEKPLYLVGVSMGASTVLMTSGLELPENVKGIIADCGFTSPKEIWHSVMQNLNIRGSFVYPAANLIIRSKAGFSGDDYSTVTALEKNTRPVLFVHGLNDVFVPSSMTLQNYNACKAPKELLLVENADHGLSFVTAPERYKKVLLRFIHNCENGGFEQ